MLVENVKNQIYSTGNLYLECLGKWQVYGNQISNVIAVHYRTQCTQQSQNNASSPETLEPWGGNVTCCAALKHNILAFQNAKSLSSKSLRSFFTHFLPSAKLWISTAQILQMCTYVSVKTDYIKVQTKIDSS